MNADVPSRRRVVLFCLLGVGVGLTSFMAFSTMPLMLLTPVLLCLMFVGGGMPAFMVASMLTCVEMVALGGLMGALAAFVALVVPPLLSISAAKAKLPFLKQMRISLAAQVGGVLVTLLALSALSGGQLIEQIMETMRSAVLIMPDAVQDSLLATLYPDLAGSAALTAAERAPYLDDFFNLLRSSLSLNMLPMLVQGSLFTAGIVGYCTPRALYRRGALDASQFVPISRWFLSSSVTTGMLLTTLLSYALNWAGIAGMESVCLTMETIAIAVFTAQGIAAMDRPMCAVHAGTVRKLLLTGAMMAFASQIVALIGLCSALFGRKGMLKELKDKFKRRED